MPSLLPRLYFEDFAPGTSRTFGPKTLTKEEIIAFAREFDNQPMHADEEAARKGYYGSLVASGWHLCAVFQRMCWDGFLWETASMGAPGVEEVRWQKPAMPGDVLALRLSLLEARVSVQRPEMGRVRIFAELLNQRGEAVVTVRYWALLRRRDPTAPAHAQAPRQEEEEAPAASPSPLVIPGGHSTLAAPPLEDMPLGRSFDLGRFTFTVDDIKRFASTYDPQPFHVDEAAARASHFGGLIASGWHTAAVFMKMILKGQFGLYREAAAAGEPVARVGPSPGFTDLRWLKPVYAGDTLHFKSQTVEKRAMRSRPQWGILFNRGTGHNQRGELAYEFRGSVLWERRTTDDSDDG